VVASVASVMRVSLKSRIDMERLLIGLATSVCAKAQAARSSPGGRRGGIRTKCDGRHAAAVVRAPRRFVERVLWPEFRDLDHDLQAYLHEVTLKVIREEVFADTSEAQEVPEALPAACRAGQSTGAAGKFQPKPAVAGRNDRRPIRAIA
jgi:hypothetical protein